MSHLENWHKLLNKSTGKAKFFCTDEVIKAEKFKKDFGLDYENMVELPIGTWSVSDIGYVWKHMLEECTGRSDNWALEATVGVCEQDDIPYEHRKTMMKQMFRSWYQTAVRA